MGIEQETFVLKHSLKKSLAELSINNSGRLLRHGVDRLIEASAIYSPDEFAKEFKQAIIDGYFPIILSSHQSHSDAIIISRITRDLTFAANAVLPESEQSKGFLMPIAASVGSGHQDALLKIMYDKIGPILDRNMILPVDMTRAKDHKEHPDLALNRKEFAREMIRKIRDGYGGILLFPEGTVEAGRPDENGNPKGMQPLTEGSISTFTSFGERSGKKIVYIPVGIDGTRNILRGDKRPPLITLVAAFVSPHPSLAVVKVGMPIRSDSMELQGLQNADRDKLIGKTIANLIPPYMGGVYA